MRKTEARPLSDLIHAYAGRAALVMGGGLSLPEQAARAPSDAVLISANQHGCLLRRCDFLVCLDDLSQKTITLPTGLRDIRDLGVPIVSVRRQIADIRIFEKPEASAGVTAAWFAWVIGCAPILLAGMDCYAGGTYFHDPAAASTGTHIPKASHVARWARLPKIAPDGMFRALGGPLLDVFPAYDPRERAIARPRPASIPGTSGTPVHVKRSWRLHPVEYAPGDVAHLSRGELRRGINERAIERVRA